MAKGLKHGAVAIITGASSGIGKDLAIQLAKKYKARLVINARSDDALNETASEIKRVGGEVVTVCGDIADKTVSARLVDLCKSTYGKVDILVNNAGFAKPGPMPSLTVDDWRHVFEVNFFAPLELTYALLPDFMASDSAKVVNIASVAGKLAFPGSVCYASSKFALTGFSEGMAAELGPKGIDVITVCPGLVRTDFFKKNKNAQDITAMAQENTFQGWVVKNFVSISSEEAALDILKACERGGSHEIILTAPGKIIERMTGICPPAAHWLSKFVPADRGPRETQPPDNK